MKRICYLLLLTTSIHYCDGQNKVIYVSTNQSGGTSSWFKSQQELFKKFHLKNLMKAKDTLHFRFSSGIQTIDIWTNNYQTFKGKLTDYTSRIDADKGKYQKYADKRYYSKATTIDTSTTRLIYTLFQSKLIFKIPSQDSITGWRDGLDGITYCIEYSTPEYYSFKRYWTPSAYKDKIPEAKKIFELARDLEHLLNLNQSFNNFISSLPSGTYYGGGIRIISITKKE